MALSWARIWTSDSLEVQVLCWIVETSLTLVWHCSQRLHCNCILPDSSYIILSFYLHFLGCVTSASVLPDAIRGHASKSAAAVHPFSAWRCIVSTQDHFLWVAEKEGVLLQAFMAWEGIVTAFVIVLRHHELYCGLEPVNHEKALQQLLWLLSANYI